MELLPLLVLEPGEAAILPGERRRLRLLAPRALTAVRLAGRADHALAAIAFDPAQHRVGEALAPDPERLLAVATRCRLLRADTEAGWAVVRGLDRREVAGTSSGGCCAHDDPHQDGTEARCVPFVARTGPDDEAAWEALAAELGALELLPALRREPSLEARIDRLARWLALPPWVQGEVLGAQALERRIERLREAVREIALPGSSFRHEPLATPYGDADAYFEDLVRAYDARARARAPAGLDETERADALVRDGARRIQRRAAAVRALAAEGLVRRRLAASRQLPALERIRAEHGLGVDAMDALLVAGLGNHERFGHRLRQASRLLPPGEVPLPAWIAALEAGAFPA